MNFMTTTIEAPRVQVRVAPGEVRVNSLLAPQTCVECAHDWDHCHDAVIVHATGVAECAQGDCRLAIESHAHRVRCEELLSGCDCDG